jgi:hypothetical protein
MGVAKDGTSVAAPLLCYAAVSRTTSGNTKMRLLLALIVIIYLIGVGVVLSPTVRSTWDSAPASAMAESIAQELPNALAWPVRAAHAFARS